MEAASNRELPRQKTETKENVLQEEFLANVSHELRTPVHAILSFSKLGKNLDHSVNKEAQEFFSIINESGQRLLTMLDSLLDLSKLESGRMHFDFQENNMASVIGTVMMELSPLAQEKDITIEVKEPKEFLPAKFDLNYIMQVVRNLLFNAIKFSPEGKDITTRFDYATHMDDEGKDMNTVKVSVADKGMGIAAGDLNSIFDKFVMGGNSKHTEGTGLGLAICKEIIEGHGGEIWAENNRHGGATFTFLIPTRM